ncbi:hypothetical protein E2C01_027740 [Portunus trituberculatus]|uniref:Uncharacterized protein n=1 Tax=Portunus trituberculatus TaxID=210409 RepID=A0A5B7ELP7_PORTR|nr:hypothetical protein [Portunus trituberculatus]
MQNLPPNIATPPRHSRDEVRGQHKVVLQDDGEVSFRVELEHFLQREPDVFIDPLRGACREGEPQRE